MPEVIVKYTGDISAAMSALSAQAEILGDSFAIITIESELIPELYNFREIEYIELPKNLSLSLRESMSESCITQVHSMGAGRYGLSGKGVIVGIIDSGVDYTHPDFIDNQGNSRILFMWDQTSEGIPPGGFFSGVEYTAAQFSQALKSPNPHSAIPATDTVGHGTAVAGIAAGNGRSSGGVELGVAFEASLIVVRLGQRGRESFARTTEIMRALKYVYDRATELNMPIAVNLSFGTNNGSHTGNSLFEMYIDAISARWKSVIVAASGNEGFAGHHFRGIIESGQTAEASLTVAGGLKSLYITLWKNFADTLDFRIISPSGKTSPIASRDNPFVKMAVDGADIAIYYGQPSFYNHNQEVYISISSQDDSIPDGIWRIIVTGREVVDGEFEIWLPTIEEVGVDTAFTYPDPYNTLTLPSTAQKVITTGGYDARIGSAADFSGRGTIFGKPDVVAPAVEILTTRAGGGYDIFTGTSMAAPFVTGSAALMMEWGIVQRNDPFLYGQRIKAYLQKGASRSPDITYPNPIWGYGALCLKRTMDYLQGGG